MNEHIPALEFIIPSLRAMITTYDLPPYSGGSSARVSLWTIEVRNCTAFFNFLRKISCSSLSLVTRDVTLLPHSPPIGMEWAVCGTGRVHQLEVTFCHVHILGDLVGSQSS